LWVKCAALKWLTQRKSDTRGSRSQVRAPSRRQRSPIWQLVTGIKVILSSLRRFTNRIIPSLRQYRSLIFGLGAITVQNKWQPSSGSRAISLKTRTTKLVRRDSILEMRRITLMRGYRANLFQQCVYTIASSLALSHAVQLLMLARPERTGDAVMQLAKTDKMRRHENHDENFATLVRGDIPIVPTLDTQLSEKTPCG
jgi:hypothetical protein